MNIGAPQYNKQNDECIYYLKKYSLQQKTKWEKCMPHAQMNDYSW